MQIELNEQEANVLLQLIDAATKALGLQAAEAAVVLARKVKQAAEATGPVAPAEPPTHPYPQVVEPPKAPADGFTEG